MTQQHRAPEPRGDDWMAWGRRLMLYLGQTRSQLVQQTGGESAAEDGVIMWDRINEWPVVSYDGEWRQIVIRGGHARFLRTTGQTAASADTAYSITYDAPTGNTRIDRDAINNERIVFSEAGEYMLSFTAEITSSSGSDVKFYFWPAKNGTNMDNMTVIKTIHNNGGIMTASRTFVIDLDANDYIEMKWAVDSTSGSLSATAATSFSPASPASTLTISRIHE